jgi:hypothetical protein
MDSVRVSVVGSIEIHGHDPSRGVRMTRILGSSGRDVAYGSAMNQQGQVQTLKLDVYKPTTDTVTSRPASPRSCS